MLRSLEILAKLSLSNSLSMSKSTIHYYCIVFYLVHTYVSLTALEYIYTFNVSQAMWKKNNNKSFRIYSGFD